MFSHTDPHGKPGMHRSCCRGWRLLQPEANGRFRKTNCSFFVEFCGGCDEDVSIMVGSPTKSFFLANGTVQVIQGDRILTILLEVT